METEKAAGLVDAFFDRVPGIRACVLLLSTEEGCQAVGAGPLIERLGLIEYARAMARAEAIVDRKNADVQLRDFLTAFDAWAAKDSSDIGGDHDEFDAMLSARDAVRETGWC